MSKRTRNVFEQGATNSSLYSAPSENPTLDDALDAWKAVLGEDDGALEGGGGGAAAAAGEGGEDDVVAADLLADVAVNSSSSAASPPRAPRSKESPVSPDSPDLLECQEKNWCALHAFNNAVGKKEFGPENAKAMERMMYYNELALHEAEQSKRKLMAQRSKGGYKFKRAEFPSEAEWIAQNTAFEEQGVTIDGLQRLAALKGYSVDEVAGSPEAASEYEYDSRKRYIIVGNYTSDPGQWHALALKKGRMIESAIGYDEDGVGIAASWDVTKPGAQTYPRNFVPHYVYLITRPKKASSGGGSST